VDYENTSNSNRHLSITWVNDGGGVMSKTPDILIPALRQYAHNTKEGELFAGYDYEAVNKIVEALEQENKELKLDNGLFKIHVYDEAIRLKNCEKALVERDAEIKELKQQLDDNHIRAEEIIRAREATITRLQVENHELSELDYQPIPSMFAENIGNSLASKECVKLRKQLSEQVAKEVNAKCVKCGSRLFETHTPQLLNTIKADAIESAARQVVSDYGCDNYPHVQDFVEIIQQLRKGEEYGRLY
jgi:hypothetical protein